MNVIQSLARQLEEVLSDPGLRPAAARDLFPMFQRFRALAEDGLSDGSFWCPGVLSDLEEIEAAFVRAQLRPSDWNECREAARALLRKIQPEFNETHLRQSEERQRAGWLAPAALVGMAGLLIFAVSPFWQARQLHAASDEEAAGPAVTTQANSEEIEASRLVGLNPTSGRSVDRSAPQRPPLPPPGQP
jgi:hypothetical protein